MRRRTLLVGTGALVLRGCISYGSDDLDGANGDDSDGSDDTNGTNESDESKNDDPLDESEAGGYEECSREIVRYDEFPAEIQIEIDAALDGEYETDRVYLRDAVNVDESYVSVEDEYYDPSVESDDDRETLTLRRIKPNALPRPRPVSVEHDLEGARTIEIEVVADDGTVLLEGSRDLHPGGDVEFGKVRQVGTHELRVTVSEDGTVEREATDSVRIDESHFDVIVVVNAEEVFVTGSVVELVECRFEE